VEGINASFRHIASFRRAAASGRYPGMVDIAQPSPSGAWLILLFSFFEWPLLGKLAISQATARQP
jgi:hypothetical protein